MKKRLFSTMLLLAVVFHLLIIPTTVLAAQNFNVYEGHKSLKIHIDAADGNKIFSQTVTLKSNTNYSVSFMSKGEGAASCVTMTYPNYQYLKSAAIKKGNIWQKNTFRFNTGDTTSIWFYLMTTSGSGNADLYVDNFSLTEDGTQTNMLQNPGFENDTMSWSAETSVFMLETSEDEVGTGDHIFDMEDTPINQPQGNDQLDLYAGHRSLKYIASDLSHRVSQNVNAEISYPTDLYNISIWTKSRDNLQIDLNVKDSEGNNLLDGGVPHRITASSIWTRTVLPFSASSNKNLTVDLISIPGQSGVLYADFCYLYPQQKPVGLSLASSANVLQDPSFENDDVWSGIEGDFSFYERYDGVQGDISGGIRIMTLGDSITAGDRNTSGTAGYKRTLYEKYKADGMNVNFVGPMSLNQDQGFPVGSGHASLFNILTQEQDRNQIEALITSFEPQVILMMLGTNDIMQGLPETPNRISELIDRITAANPNIELYVSTLTPLADLEMNNMVQSLNGDIETIVADKNNLRVHLADMYSAISAESDLSDNKHPNDAGYNKMAQKWFDTTKDLLKTMPPAKFIPDAITAYDGKTSLKQHSYYKPALNIDITTMLSIPTSSKLEPNTDYILTFMAKGDQDISVYVNIMSAPSYSLFKNYSFYAGPKWAKYKFSFNSENLSSAYFAFMNLCMQTGSIYIDCVELCKNGTTDNLILNPSMEKRDENGKTSNWGFDSSVFSFVTDTTINISINDGVKEIEKLESPGTLTISTTIADVLNEAYLIAAVYKKGIMQKCAISEKGLDLTVPITLDAIEDTELKVFLMYADNPMEPLLINPVVINKYERIY